MRNRSMIMRSRLIRLSGTVIGTGVLIAAALVGGSGVGASAPTCGGEHPTASPGRQWTCTFDEEFSGTSLNRQTWTVQTTAQAGWHSGNECALDSPQTISESNGHLNLTVRKVSPFVCTAPHTSFTTSYIGSSVYTRSFSQQYGRFEVRAEFAYGRGHPGIQGALWLYPANSRTSTLLAGPTEIDIAEQYSVHQSLVVPTVHSYTAVTSGTNNYCNVNGAENGFHDYVVTWTPSTIVVQFDGHTCLSMPAPLSVSMAGSHPFLIALSQAPGIGRNAPNATTALPATEEIDYVRAWK